MSLKENTVQEVAHLARIMIEADRLQQYTHDLGCILAFVERMNEVNTDDVPPLAHPLDVDAYMRDDEVTHSDSRRQFQDGVESVTEEGYYTVPQVIDSS